MIFRDSLGAPFRPIGTIWVPSGTERNGFETASWYETVAFPGQTVTLYSNGYYVKWKVTGYVVDSFFGGGRKTEPGTVRDHHFNTYTFMFAERYMDGSWADKHEYVIELLPEYGVGCAPYQHDPSKIGYFLSMPESGHPLLVKRAEMAGHNWDTHTYQVSWRGELQENIVVARNDGFNGDTLDVAYRRASERLSLVSA